MRWPVVGFTAVFLAAVTAMVFQGEDLWAVAIFMGGFFIAAADVGKKEGGPSVGN